MKVTIMGRKWRIRTAPKSELSQRYGECSEPAKPKRSIVIEEGMEPEREFAVLIHEMLHACEFYLLPENWVTQAAGDMAIALRKLGYRRMK